MAGIRHPLAFVMEACDDTAYSVLDIEDAVKKGLVSVPDVLWWLDEASKDETLTDEQRKVLIAVQRSAQHDYTYYRNQDLSPEELNDLAIQKFRVYAIGAMVYAIVDEFENKIDCIISGTYKTDLLTCSSAGALCKELKKFARRHAYVHRSVREVELEGHNVIRELMSIFWEAIAAKRKCVDARSILMFTVVYRKITAALLKSRTTGFPIDTLIASY
jgi:dGTPase